MEIQRTASKEKVGQTKMPEAVEAPSETVKPSTVKALRSLDGPIAWGQHGSARSDFRSNFPAPAWMKVG